MSHTQVNSEIPYLGAVPATWNISRNKTVFSPSKTIVGDASSATQLLSLTTSGVKTKDINSPDGKLPATFETYQLVDDDQLVMCLFDMDQSAVFAGKSPYNGMISPAYVVLTCKEQMKPEFADYWFSYIFIGRKFAYYAKNIRYTMGWDDFSQMLIPVPPREEQERIVSFLDAETAKIDHLIAKQRELNNLTTSRLQVWREHAFWGGATSDPFLNPPDGWVVLRNRNILKHVDGRSETGQEEMLSVSHITGVTPRSMKNVTMFEAESTVGYKLVTKNELVINTMWAWMGALGVSQYEGIVSPSYDVYKFRDLDSVNPMYFDYMYRTAAYATLMKANSRGIWESRLRLYPEIFLRLSSLVPSKKQQDWLVSENRERTTEAESMIARGNAAIDLLQERRSALITAAVTGQIAV